MPETINQVWSMDFMHDQLSDGSSRKTLKDEFGQLPIEIPRHCHASFEPQLIPKHQTCWAGFDDENQRRMLEG